MPPERPSLLLGNERGTVLLFVLGILLFCAVFGGLAIDLAFFSTAKGELQRSMDAAALAGAGKLGSDDSVFDAVRDETQKFAGLNPTRANLSATNPTGAITLDLNLGNDPSGNIVLGVWDGTSFTSDLIPDGSTVNAVRAQYATQVPTSWLGILGFNTLPVSAQAIAVGTKSLPATRFTIDGEMIAPGIPVIEDLAAELGILPEDLISDLDGDWFIDLPPGQVLELPTGQVGDPAFFDISHPAYPFSGLSGNSSYSHADFLNWNEDSDSWRYTVVPLEMLDPLLGLSPVEDPSLYPSYVNPDFIHVSPVYKSDVTDLDPVVVGTDPIPAVSALGIRRGLLVFKILGVGADPDGPGSKLPNLIIEIVDPNTVFIDGVTPFTRRMRLVR